MAGGGIIEAGGQSVGAGVTSGGVGAPAAGVHPAVAVVGSVDVDGGNEDDVVFAEAAAPVVDAAAALRQGYVFLLGNEETHPSDLARTSEFSAGFSVVRLLCV